MVERKWDKERMRKVMDESKKEFFDLTERLYLHYSSLKFFVELLITIKKVTCLAHLEKYHFLLEYFWDF